MPYEQAQITVTKVEEFSQLKSALERILAPAAVERFLGKLEGKSLHVREFEKVVARGVLEDVDAALAKSGRRAKSLYEALALSDRAVVREFYLERIETVDAKVREKYRKVYRYY